MSGSRERVARFWDDVVADFLAGRTDAFSREPLPRWLGAYRGRGAGAADLEALPEPYLGSLDREPRAVFLALNPGPVEPAFQHRGGAFPREIKGLGSYRSWAASWPYLREPWGRNRHHESRLRFMRDWCGDTALGAKDMLALELYPWHSQRLTGPLRVDPDIVREFILDPIAELRRPLAFAFGADWFRILQGLPGAEIEHPFGPEGERYQGRVPSRRVIIARVPGVTIVAEKRRGSAGPPATDETQHLKSAIAGSLGA